MSAEEQRFGVDSVRPSTESCVRYTVRDVLLQETALSEVDLVVDIIRQTRKNMSTLWNSDSCSFSVRPFQLM